MAATSYVVMPRSRALDWACAAAIFLWGVTLLFPGATLEASDAYRLLRELADEGVWAAIFLATGALRFAALLINGHWKEGSPVLRAIAACLGFVCWTLIFTGFLELSLDRGVVSVGAAMYLVLMGADIFSAARAGADAVRARQVAHGIFRRG